MSRSAAATGALALGPIGACVADPFGLPELSPAHRTTDLPNFIVILADDLGYGDLGAFGGRRIRTPRLDGLAAEGMRLTSFYVPSPICTPSRAGLLTGRHQIRHGLDRVLLERHRQGLPPGETTLAEALKRLGYVTGCIGKWHLGHAAPAQLPLGNGFQHFFGLPYSHDIWPAPLYHDAEILSQRLHVDDLTIRFTRHAIAFLDRHKNEAFFLYLPFTAPHVPLRPSSGFKGKSGAGPYGDVVEELDWCAGALFDALEQLELAEHTLVLFTSDNGPDTACGCGTAGPLSAGKRTVFEGGVRVPAIVRWRGRVPAGSTRDAPASTLDLYPSLLRFAGGDVGPGHPIDGEDIGGLLLGGPDPAERSLLFFLSGRDVRAVRRGPWKLHLPRHDAPAKLFDLATDIGEERDVSDLHPEVVQEISAAVALWRASALAAEER